MISGQTSADAQVRSKPENWQSLLESIELIVMDVDGTMTDGSMYFSAQGEAMKRFSVHDGMGVTLARRAGLSVAIMTSEDTEIVRKRAQKLGIEHVIMGSRSKQEDVRVLSEKIGTVLERVAFIGDDVNDALAMQVVGLAACPSDARPYIKSIVSYVCEAKGGHGAVRELIELILVAQGKSLLLPEHW